MVIIRLTSQNWWKWTSEKKNWTLWNQFFFFCMWHISDFYSLQNNAFYDSLVIWVSGDPWPWEVWIPGNFMHKNSCSCIWRKSLITQAQVLVAIKIFLTTQFSIWCWLWFKIEIMNWILKMSCRPFYSKIYLIMLINCTFFLRTYKFMV